jgi:hypothetical protein
MFTSPSQTGSAWKPQRTWLITMDAVGLVFVAAATAKLEYDLSKCRQWETDEQIVVKKEGFLNTIC